MNMIELIAARRDGRTHSRGDLEFLAQGAASGEIPDYQLAAWLMAAYLNPLDPDETAWLTAAMADSGGKVDRAGLPRPWVDKHSTGGVGDKTTIALLPILAACGLTVIKMSGRGLGVTGGTIDKLESIPGFRTDLAPDAMKTQAKRIGLALAGQTQALAPADKVLYALRDTTATVSSIPLIVSSILSKKVAGGADTVLLDVKCGSGAFMRSREAARELASALRNTGDLLGLRVEALVTDMEQPLGATVGNALEVREAMQTLTGESTGRFRDLVVGLAGSLLDLAGVVVKGETGEQWASRAIDSGEAADAAERWIEAQAGDPRIVREPHRLESAPETATFAAGDAGSISRIDALVAGEVALALGAGRKTKEDRIDPRVGLEFHVQIGDRVERGQPLVTVHARTRAQAQAGLDRMLGGIDVVDREVAKRPWLLERAT